MARFLLLSLILFITNCNNNPTEPVVNTSWVFIANEGTMGEKNGSISMIDDFGNVLETNALGEVVNSIEVHDSKLIVLVNGGQNLDLEDSKIIIFDITSNGLDMPGINISTGGSAPREMVILNEKIYFTNHNSEDVKVFNLDTYNIDASIPVGSMPEGIITDGTSLWVANSGGTTVHEINIETKSVSNIYEVGEGPQNLLRHNGETFVSRTYYNDNWTETYHGLTKIKINGEITINSYGIGAPCGGSVLAFQDNIYRSFNGSLNRIDSDLNLEDVYIGMFTQGQLYHIEIIDENFWFALTDYQSFNKVYVLDSNGNSLAEYDAGQNPGDFATWNKEYQEQ